MRGASINYLHLAKSLGKEILQLLIKLLIHKQDKDSQLRHLLRLASIVQIGENKV